MSTQVKHLDKCFGSRRQFDVQSVNLAHPGLLELDSSTMPFPSVKTAPVVTFDMDIKVEPNVQMPANVEGLALERLGTWYATQATLPARTFGTPSNDGVDDSSFKQHDQIKSEPMDSDCSSYADETAASYSPEPVGGLKREREDDEDDEIDGLGKWLTEDDFDGCNDESGIESLFDDSDLKVERRCYQANRDKKAKAQTRVQAEPERAQITVKVEGPQSEYEYADTDVDSSNVVTWLSSLPQRPEELADLRAYAELFLKRIQEMESNMRTVNERRDHLGGLFRLTVGMQKEIKALKANSGRYGRCRAGCRSLDEDGLDEYNSDDTMF